MMTSDWARIVRRVRDQNIISQMTLAETLGVDQATVSRWERGASIPSRKRQVMLRDMIRHEFDPRLLESVTNSPACVRLVEADPKKAITLIRIASRSYMNFYGLRHIDYREGVDMRRLISEEHAAQIETVSAHPAFRDGAAYALHGRTKAPNGDVFEWANHWINGGDAGPLWFITLSRTHDSQLPYYKVLTLDEMID